MLDAILADDRHDGAELCVYHRGEVVADLAGGALARESLTGVYSASKGIAAMTVARVIDAGELDLEAPVSRYWPEFAAEGKATVTVGEALAHQAGLPAVDGDVTLAELVESRAAAARLAGQMPWWRPGSAFGYHAVTIGLLMEELVQRTTGRRLQEVFEHDIRAPRAADAYLGLPAEEDHRYVRLGDMVLTTEELAEIAARPVDAIQRTVFGNTDVPDDRSDAGFSTNNAVFRRGGPAAVGATASARGLARLYADTLPSSTRPIASARTLRAMAQQRSWGIDRVLGVPNAFGAVFMVPQPRLPFGEVGSFGHDGAGGALAFADPATDLAFGYIPTPMQYPGGADPQAVRLATAAGAIARSLTRVAAPS